MQLKQASFDGRILMPLRRPLNDQEQINLPRVLVLIELAAGTDECLLWNDEPTSCSVVVLAVNDPPGTSATSSLTGRARCGERNASMGCTRTDFF
jgi:hypothetical protein